MRAEEKHVETILVREKELATLSEQIEKLQGELTSSNKQVF